MVEPRGERAHRSWTLICVLAGLSCLASLGVYLVHVPDFFMGDDFELAGDALAGASPLEPYNGSTATEVLEAQIRCMILCASDPYAVVGIIDAFGRKPDLVAGPAANTEAGIALVRRLTGLEALDARNPAAAGELDHTLRSALS